MQISRELNLVIPVQRETGVIYVHAVPLSTAAFERHFLLISKVFNAIYTEGLSYTTGPRIAALLLKRIADQSNMTEEATTLFQELARTSSFIGPDHQTVPLQVALDQQLMNEREVSEVQNCLTFFIVASAMHLSNEVAAILKGAGRLWNASCTSLNSTDFAATLVTSTGTVSGGGTVVTA